MTSDFGFPSGSRNSSPTQAGFLEDLVDPELHPEFASLPQPQSPSTGNPAPDFSQNPHYELPHDPDNAASNFNQYLWTHLDELSTNPTASEYNDSSAVDSSLSAYSTHPTSLPSTDLSAGFPDPQLESRPEIAQEGEQESTSHMLPPSTSHSSGAYPNEPLFAGHSSRYGPTTGGTVPMFNRDLQDRAQQPRDSWRNVEEGQVASRNVQFPSNNSHLPDTSQPVPSHSSSQESAVLRRESTNTPHISTNRPIAQPRPKNPGLRNTGSVTPHNMIQQHNHYAAQRPVPMQRNAHQNAGHNTQASGYPSNATQHMYPQSNAHMNQQPHSFMNPQSKFDINDYEIMLIPKRRGIESSQHSSVYPPTRSLQNQYQNPQYNYGVLPADISSHQHLNLLSYPRHHVPSQQEYSPSVYHQHSIPQIPEHNPHYSDRYQHPMNTMSNRPESSFTYNPVFQTAPHLQESQSRINMMNYATGMTLQPQDLVPAQEQGATNSQYPPMPSPQPSSLGAPAAVGTRGTPKIATRGNASRQLLPALSVEQSTRRRARNPGRPVSSAPAPGQADSPATKIVNGLDLSQPWHLGTEHQQRAFVLINVNNEALEQVIWDALLAAKNDFKSKQQKYDNAARIEKVKRERERDGNVIAASTDDDRNQRWRCGEPGCLNSKKPEGGKSELSQHYRDHHPELEYNPSTFYMSDYPDERCPRQLLWAMFYWRLNGKFPAFYPVTRKEANDDKASRQICLKFITAVQRAVQSAGFTIPPTAALVSRAHPACQGLAPIAVSSATVAPSLAAPSSSAAPAIADAFASPAPVLRSHKRSLTDEGPTTVKRTRAGDETELTPLPSLAQTGQRSDESQSLAPLDNSQFVSLGEIETPRASGLPAANIQSARFSFQNPSQTPNPWEAVGDTGDDYLDSPYQ